MSAFDIQYGRRTAYEGLLVVPEPVPLPPFPLGTPDALAPLPPVSVAAPAPLVPPVPPVSPEAPTPPPTPPFEASPLVLVAGAQLPVSTDIVAVTTPCASTSAGARSNPKTRPQLGIFMLVEIA